MRRSTRWDAEFTEFVEARSPQLYRNAYLLTTSPHAAENLVQTALAKAYAAWWRVRGASDPVAYVHGELSDLDRAVVVLRYWEDRSVADTAAQLGLSVAAVRNRSLPALRSLRGLLGEDALSGQTNGSGS